MGQIVFLLVCLLSTSTYSQRAAAWDYKGHRVVGSIADNLLRAKAKQQIALILGFDLRIAGSVGRLREECCAG
jgi:hypothetical protein